MDKRGVSMGRVDWLAVIVAANLATALRIVWYGPLAGRNTLMRRWSRAGARRRQHWVGMILMLLLSAAMLGHMFARMTPGKPWLYFMMSGGVAATFIAPALWLALGRRGIRVEETAFEAAYWLAAYLAMGATFWVLA